MLHVERAVIKWMNYTLLTDFSRSIGTRIHGTRILSVYLVPDAYHIWYTQRRHVVDLYIYVHSTCAHVELSYVEVDPQLTYSS
jgi:hypothetical protein